MMSVSRLRRQNSGGAAVEFALICPLFILCLFSMIAWGFYIATCHSLQAMASDTVRVAVAGLSAEERKLLAHEYISSEASGFTLVDGRRLNVWVEDDRIRPNQFTVTLSYDAGDLPIWNLLTFALPDHVIVRTASIRIGGL